MFFIDTGTGQVATHAMLRERGLLATSGQPELPWLRIQGTGDATTLWYSVMRKRTRGVFIGTLCIRHSDHHASLLRDGWEEVAPQDIGEVAPGPWTPGHEGSLSDVG